jgi:hypothetical protein
VGQGGRVSTMQQFPYKEDDTYVYIYRWYNGSITGRTSPCQNAVEVVCGVGHWGRTLTI